MASFNVSILFETPPLNDLHKASGSEVKNKPSNFLQNDKTQELVAELIDAENPSSVNIEPVSAIRGGIGQGTYVVKELVYAYAMWISAKFHLKVINSFDALINHRQQLPQSFAEALQLAADQAKKIELDKPAMGKTTMMQLIANHVAIIQKKPVLIMSGEMPKEQIAMRLCCAMAPADIGLLRNSPHKLPKDEFTAYTNAVVMLKNVPMQINDTSRPSIANIRESIRKIQHQYGSVGAVLVDYLQIMKTTKPFAREDLKIAYFTGELKAMAKEFNCVIVLLSQLNRELEKRPNKRPVLSDLRESGAIEQDADQIVFLYRDEIYNKESQYRGIAEAIVGKNRHGEAGTAFMHAQLKYCQFTNLDHDALNQIQGSL